MHKRRGERGANLVEFALVLPLLVLLLAGVADFGRAFNNYIIITNASREGARYGSRFPTVQSGIEQAAIQEAGNWGVNLVPADITIDTTGISPGSRISVMVTFQFPTILGGVVGVNDLTLSATTQMIIFGLDES
jgi:Flp pilus assembly protein TadG